MSAEVIRQIARSLPDDPKEQREIYRAARELMLRAEPPRETVFRLFMSNGVAAAGVTAVDLGLFRILAADPNHTFTVEELSQKTGAEPMLLMRLLKVLNAWGYWAFPDPMSFERPAAQNQSNGPMFLALPEYLKKTGYKNPMDPTNTAFNLAYHTNKEIFEWFGENKYWSDTLMSFMSVQRQGQEPWMSRPHLLQGFDLALSQHDLERNRAQFVDVGGGAGHQSIAFREHFPHLKGPVILQDLPFILPLAEKNPRISELDITTQPHDFMTPQTPEAKGATIFHMRNVLHDWNDDKNAIILGHIRDAMAEDSILMIDEAVVPDTDMAVQVAAIDMVMMAAPAAQERSEGMWRKLVEERVGMRVRGIRTYDEQTRDSLIFVARA
ncbi:S-adenosyl-L-methionine-dependent methyltransferase [Teratosphaeria nubilosa]|uniref:S-adenosyl-L-methionine-dependent methyltransferase n=1 Tax=Teratosphaeria nubilosa TaxID=161662 RepID=A0A6G1LNI4_9PEZI|nr:S-adenosyl-L-methionine-dependent methyltransferase [Teratosphaeria nubilosa]